MTAERPARQAMPVWTYLHCDEGVALTVPDDATPMDALIEMLEQGYGGEASDYLVSDLVRYAARHCVRMEVWFSCLREYREANCDDPDQDYWAPDGDGKRFIQVAWYPHSIYSLGDRVEEVLAEADR